ncbi:LysM peptidoglycan-binding domain-containing protein, partial [Streptomyces xiamenensis]|uniref:LysM peptidoglycan-binding domain-containing protein n=1 Tax=Streptomyces xiamenensis TaxID=408015 RepID=UPI00368DFA17
VGWDLFIRDRQSTENTVERAPVASGDTYTVVAGDSLSKIAAAHGVSWQQLYQQNKSVVGDDPNLIFPGQQLAL